MNESTTRSLATRSTEARSTTAGSTTAGSTAIAAVLTAFFAICATTTSYAQDPPQASASEQERQREPGTAPSGSASTAPNVDLEDLLASVAASSDKEFLIDSRATAHIYVGGTALDDPTYPLLLSILHANGLAAVEIDGRVHVLPASDARQLPGRVVQRDDASIPDDEWVTRVITIRNGNAARLVPILRPLMPQPAHLAAMVEDSESATKLIIVDRYANVRRITALVEALTQ